MKIQEAFQVIIQNEIQQKAIYDFAIKIYNYVSFPKDCSNYPVRVYMDYNYCSWDYFHNNHKKLKLFPVLSYKEFEEKYLPNSKRNKNMKQKIFNIFENHIVKFSTEFEQEAFQAFLIENGIENEKHRNSNVNTLILFYENIRLDHIILENEQITTNYIDYIERQYPYSSRKIISSDEFLTLFNKPDVSMPKINGYEGKIKDHLVKYGCAEISFKMLEDAFNVSSTFGNSNIEAVKLDSGVEITRKHWKQINEFTNNP